MSKQVDYTTAKRAARRAASQMVKEMTRKVLDDEAIGVEATEVEVLEQELYQRKQRLSDKLLSKFKGNYV